MSDQTPDLDPEFVETEEALQQQAEEIEARKAELTELAARAQAVMQDHQAVRQCVSSMVAARQLYVMCLYELDKQLKKLPEEQQHPGLDECLRQAVMVQADKPFDHNDLYLGFQETVYPWMLRTVDRHNREEEQERKLELEDEEKARRGRALPLGLAYDPVLGSLLPRDKSLVLVGWKPAVRYVLDQMLNTVLTARDGQLFQVIRLVVNQRKPEPQRQLVRLPAKAWRNCCSSNQSWPLLFQNGIMPMLSEPPDLLMVDDLVHAAHGQFGHRTASRSAADAHKKFRDWCSKTGSGLLAGVLQEGKEPEDLGTLQWETLRTFATLRPVWVEDVRDAPDHYRLVIGKDAYETIVPKQVLNDYGQERSVLLPGEE